MLRRSRQVLQEGLARISKMTATTKPFCNAKQTLFSPSQVAEEFVLGNQITPLTASAYPRSMPTRCLLKCQLGGFTPQRSPWSCSDGVRYYSRHVAFFRVDAEVQQALLDYLHETSALGFPDAECISKNCPKFRNKLIAEVSAAGMPCSKEEEVGRSIRKLLLYDPINEFEPFFESLGLTESEVSQVLPSYGNLLGLREHETLLKNYNLLRNYGISRLIIGRMFLIERNVFEWKASELKARLQAYEELGLSISAIINLASCYPSMLFDRDCARALRRLMDLGFGEKWITRSLLDDNTSYDWGKGVQTLELLLGEVGWSEEDVRVLVRNDPLFLFDDSEKKVYVATAILTKLGVKMGRIKSLLLHTPKMMSARFLHNLHTSIRFLYWIGMREGEIASLLCSHPYSMGRYPVKRPENVLSTSDPSSIRALVLCDIIRKDPYQLLEFAVKGGGRNPVLAGSDTTPAFEKTKFLLRLGYVENSDEMDVARKRFHGRPQDLNKRFDVLLNAGLSFQAARDLVKANPVVLTSSAGNLERKIDYLVNCLGYPVQKVLAYPFYLRVSLATIKARVSIIRSLKEKALFKPSWDAIRFITRSESEIETLYAKSRGQD